ncbi:MAG: dTDP-4-dehydrorhamnose 3,5-epimerase [Victivallales bacterium]|nr:dTDP-4-dehydrorhamnose 3,5-epimerase [Victivallales bacterium]MBR5840450.1 dTDP-4-dehydrorhamnose 3,5-epimerase [Victivallales bacterium]
MKTQTTEIEGIVIVEPQVFGDSRGYFMETYQKEKYAAAGIDVTFVQDNESMSRYGVVRGLHYQAEPYAQAKLIRVVAGRVLDVAVDIRKDSPTYGKVFTLELSSENKLQLFLPHGIAHGFAVLSETAVFTYKCDNFYAPQYEHTIRYDDPTLNIDWKIPINERIISEKDKKGLPFSA